MSPELPAPRPEEPKTSRFAEADENQFSVDESEEWPAREPEPEESDDDAE